MINGIVVCGNKDRSWLVPVLGSKAREISLMICYVESFATSVWVTLNLVCFHYVCRNPVLKSYIHATHECLRDDGADHAHIEAGLSKREIEHSIRSCDFLIEQDIEEALEDD